MYIRNEIVRKFLQNEFQSKVIKPLHDYCLDRSKFIHDLFTRELGE